MIMVMDTQSDQHDTYEGESGLRGKCIEIKEKCTSRVPSNETEDSFFLGREYVNIGFPETPPRTTSNLMGCLLTAAPSDHQRLSWSLEDHFHMHSFAMVIGG